MKGWEAPVTESDILSFPETWCVVPAVLEWPYLQICGFGVSVTGKRWGVGVNVGHTHGTFWLTLQLLNSWAATKQSQVGPDNRWAWWIEWPAGDMMRCRARGVDIKCFTEMKCPASDEAQHMTLITHYIIIESVFPQNVSGQVPLDSQNHAQCCDDWLHPSSVWIFINGNVSHCGLSVLYKSFIWPELWLNLELFHFFPHSSDCLRDYKKNILDLWHQITAMCFHLDTVISKTLEIT